jgi:hypothetical protein
MGFEKRRSENLDYLVTILINELYSMFSRIPLLSLFVVVATPQEFESQSSSYHTNTLSVFSPEQQDSLICI